MNKQLKYALSTIPSHWQLVKFRDVCKVRQGLQIMISERYTQPGKGRYPYITIQHLNERSKHPEYIQDPSQSVICHEEDVLMTRTGNTGIVITNVAGVFHNNFFLIDYNRELLDRFFLVNYLRFDLVQREILVRAGTTTIPDLNHGDFYKIELPLPPISEQQKIAEILSAWDTAIAKTKRLIAVLQERKKGLSQLLLTGKVHFPNFKEKWKSVHLRDIFQRVTRKVGDKKIDYVLSITATVGFVDQREKFGKVIAGKNLVNYVLLQKGEFAYNKGNSNSYPQGCVYLLEEFDEGAVPNVYFSFAEKSTNQVNAHFYKYFFESGLLNPQLEKYISSSVRGDGLFNIAFDDFFSVKIPLPPIEEQNKIAAVLDTCDNEIKLQTKKLEALKQQKKCLMQKLLTGQIRVKV